jgi:hypothetical protein
MSYLAALWQGRSERLAGRLLWRTLHVGQEWSFPWGLWRPLLGSTGLLPVKKRTRMEQGRMDWNRKGLETNHYSAIKRVIQTDVTDQSEQPPKNKSSKFRKFRPEMVLRFM